MSVIYKKNLHMKVKIEQHEPHKKLGTPVLPEG